MKQKLNFLFVISSILLQAAGGIFGKYAALSAKDMSLLALMSNLFYLFFILCLLLQAILWQQALTRYPLSFAYPFMSLVNFVVLIASYFLFHESITFKNIIGLIIISLGILSLSRKSGDLHD